MDQETPIGGTRERYNGQLLIIFDRGFDRGTLPCYVAVTLVPKASQYQG